MASEKITAIVESLKTLSVLELSELVKAVEEEFGVSAAAAVAVAAPAEGGAAAAEEKTEFDVVLTEVGPNKINVIKVVLMVFQKEKITNVFAKVFEKTIHLNARSEPTDSLLYSRN